MGDTSADIGGDFEVTTKDSIMTGKIRVLLSSPEAALTQHRTLLSCLADANMICALAVDEAHCVLNWGLRRKTEDGKKRPPFRPHYGRLVELRAIIGEVPVVALTATASPDGQKSLVKELKLFPCFSLILPPRKDNLKYIVHQLPKDADIAMYFGWLIDLLRINGKSTEKMIVFFHKIKMQSEANEYIDEELGPDGHVGDPPHNDTTHLFEMYHMKTDECVKNSVLDHFGTEGGIMRCALASSSFSMGLNIKDIKYVIHFGPAMTLDDFLQETGRAGRNGEQSYSIMLLYPRCLNSSLIS